MLRLGRMGLGTGPLGGLFEATDDRVARATIERAWELGIRYFDTAPLYGSGVAEERLGAALRDLPRDQLLVSTKVGRLLRPGVPDRNFKGGPRLGPVFDFSPDGARESLETSLERLGLDHVDLLLVHDPDDHVEEGLELLDSLRPLAAAVGVGTTDVRTALTFARRGAIDQLLLAGRYTPLDASAGDELLDVCLERGVPMIAAGVFNSGLLAGGTRFDYGAPSPRVLARTEALDEACSRHGVPLVALALQFPLRHPAVTTVLVGARSAEEIEEDVELSRLPIPPALWSEPLIAIGGAT